MPRLDQCKAASALAQKLRGAGTMLGMALWFIASLASVGVNGVLFFVGLSNKRPVIKEIIGVALPFLVVAVVLGLEPFFA